MGSVWGRYKVGMGSVWGRFGVGLGGSGVGLGLVWGRFGGDFFKISKTDFRKFYSEILKSQNIHFKC